MLFTAPIFALFSLALLVALLVVRPTTGRKLLLLVASYLFYMWWNPAFIVLILLSTAIDFLLGARISRAPDGRPRTALLIASLVSNLGLLAVFKYANFFQDNVLLAAQWLGSEPSWTTLHITLPVGISFYTFQTLSYSIDLYRREIEPAKSPLDFALFVAFFPQLVAGPIVRAREFLPQLDGPIALFFDRRTGMLILRGLAKKAVIADNLALFVSAVFDRPGDHPSLVIWAATVCFAVQIYCDFSGYSDIAIGVARILGFQLPDNFDRPYFSRSPVEFWRRWHISLSSWLRDYLYIPLGGGRGGALRTARNILVTMLLGGLWHGASWNFVLWGLLHGLVLVAHRVWRSARRRLNVDRLLPPLVGDNLARLATLYLVLALWLPFRVHDLDQALSALTRFVVFDFNFAIAGSGLGRFSPFTSVALAAGFCALHVLGHARGGLDEAIARLPTPLYLAALVVIGAVFTLLWPLHEAPFIYFQF